MKNVSIDLSYPKEAFHDNNTLKAFVLLNSEVKAIDILLKYSEKLAIEPFFRDCKSNLGLNGYQIRTEKAVNRYLLLMIINYTYCCLRSNHLNRFNTGFKIVKMSLRKIR